MLARINHTPLESYPNEATFRIYWGYPSGQRSSGMTLRPRDSGRTGDARRFRSTGADGVVDIQPGTHHGLPSRKAGAAAGQ